MHPAVQATIRQFQKDRADNAMKLAQIEAGLIAADSEEIADTRRRLAGCEAWLAANA